jgi:hypothetical protein
MSRRNEAANHVRTRIKTVAGETATITRADETIAAGVQITRVSSRKNLQSVGGEFTIDSNEQLWIIGLDVCGEDLEIGDLITVDEIPYRICESVTTGRHWQWWNIDRSAKVYTSRQWE